MFCFSHHLYRTDMINHKQAWFCYFGFNGVTICFHVIGTNVLASAGGFVFVTCCKCSNCFPVYKVLQLKVHPYFHFFIHLHFILHNKAQEQLYLAEYFKFCSRIVI